ncbi:DNA invertase Pin-like site-specific DNA recombinase [Anaerosolibacter carboniphilus]|uniref:DNA invertase Pin-like site-specific DNA recombinase n=1 Tax=Anaerosolibacter carboniphilus TaxID=1417629 RepID=A0A841KQ44_9FIRM|nr:recombinase family protein [Anaerosolibacter carboniphilus]MBB6215557.1 DNA invertase Pin-like site-specific DNA recombinase [Anaerosolibacter carboniphilus]
MRCAVYARVSTEMEAQKTSIAHQINFFEKYIQEKGWHLYRIYEDMESGRRIDNREGMQQLLADSEERKFDIILTKSISRFARNTLEGLKIIRDLKARNIRFVTIEDGFDSEAYDEFMFTLLLSIAQKESEKISERIRFGKYCRAKNGHYNGSVPPYGYKKVDRHQIAPAEDISVDVVQHIFQLYLEGNGLYKIAKELNDRAYPTPSQWMGKPNGSNVWHQSTIRKILSNQVYVGNLIQNKSATGDLLTGERKRNKEEDFIQVMDTHEGIISYEVFEEVQRRLARNKGKKSISSHHLFSGLLFCGGCGKAMHYKKAKDAYLCGTVNKMGKNQCDGAYIHGQTLLEAVIRDLKTYMIEHIDREAILEDLEREMDNDMKEQTRERNHKLLRKLETKRQRIAELFIEDKLDEDLYRRKMWETENQIALLQLKNENTEESISIDNEAFKRHIMEILELKALDQMILQKLIEKIFVFGKDKIEIHYGFRL